MRESDYETESIMSEKELNETPQENLDLIDQAAFSGNFMTDKGFFGKREKIETFEEVSERLHNLGVENVDLKGTKEIWQRQVAESMENMYEKYPELQGFIGSVRTAKLPEGVFACAGPRMTKEGFSSEIQLSEELFSKSNLEWKIVDMEIENFKGERWLAGKGLDGVLKHEMGHALHLKMIADSEGLNCGETSWDKFESVSEKFNRNAIVVKWGYDALKELGISSENIGKNLSVYGASDFGEFFAEAISEYETAKKPRPIAVRVHEKYEEYKKEDGGDEMIIMPPEEIRKYVTVDGDGKWCHASDMPKELECVFERFVKQIEKAKVYRENFR